MSDFEQTGDGAVQTSVEDLLRWDDNFYAPKVGDTEMLKRAQTAGRLTDGEVLQYADGLVINQYRGLPRVSHGGAWAGYRAELMRFPEQHTSFAVLCNLGNTNPSRLAEGVADVVLADKVKPAEKKPADAPRDATKSGANLSQYAGVYENATTGELRRFHVENGKLVFGPGNRPLPQVGPGEFEVPGFGVRFQFQGDEMRAIPESGKTTTFHRLPAPKSTDLNGYPGTYYSDELDAKWKYSVRDGKLVATTLRSGTENVLMQASDDLFMTDRGLRVQFQRENGQVVRAVVGAGRVRDLVFTREAK